MKKKIFIDGQEGTTGLQIHSRLAGRTDLELLDIAPGFRKDSKARQTLMNESDLVILCLPDAAALEAVTLVDNPQTSILDASTAHRTAPDWVYGLPELCGPQRDAIRTAARVSNPGCYPTGFLLAVRPLTEAGLVPSDYPMTVHAVSGYSGGGKKLIEAFRSRGPSPDDAWAIRPYALALSHKHVAEMQAYALLPHRPIFCPLVGHYYQGMIVTVPLFSRLCSRAFSPERAHALLTERYAEEPFVRVLPLGCDDALEGGCLSPTACNGTNRVELLVTGNAEQVLLIARLDNLGKGAAGAAVQNLNLMLGYDEGASV